jgi:hypothetical protein
VPPNGLSFLEETPIGHLSFDCEDNIKSTVDRLGHDQVAQIGRAFHGVFAQRINVARGVIGIFPAHGHLEQSRERHGQRACFIECQNHLACLTLFIWQGEDYRLAVGRYSAIAFRAFTSAFYRGRLLASSTGF